MTPTAGGLVRSPVVIEFAPSNQRWLAPPAAWFPAAPMAAALGMLVSVFSEGRVKALAGAIVLRFVLVLLYDLGAIGLAMTISSSGRALLLVVLGNPVEVGRILAVLSLEPDLQVLGPLGAYITEEVGVRTGTWLLIGALAVWTIAPMLVAIRAPNERDS